MNLHVRRFKNKQIKLSDFGPTSVSGAYRPRVPMRMDRNGSKPRYFTRVNDPVDLDAGVVELFGEGVNSLQ